MKNPFTHHRRLVLLLSVLIFLIAGGRWIGQSIDRGLQPKKVHRLGGGIKKYVRLPNVSDEYNDYKEWLINGLILSARPWSMEDAERLIAVLNDPPTEELLQRFVRDETTQKENERYMKYTLVMLTISDRIRYNDPMVHGVKKVLSQALVGRLDSPREDIQWEALRALFDAHLKVGPALRTKLVAMKLATDDPEFARTIQGYLDYFDRTQ